jgi:hypothetical protein
MNITIKSFNETHAIVDAEPGIIQELYELLSFEVPGAKYMHIYRKRLWDGYARLLNKRNNTVGKGLAHYIKSYCEENGYTFKQEFENKGFSEEVADTFIKSNRMCSGGREIELRDYQIDAIKHGICNNRSITVSVTGCLHPDTPIDVLLSAEDFNLTQDQSNTVRFDASNNIFETTITFKELHDLVKLGGKPKVFTKTGWELVTDAYKKNTPGIEIEFNDGTKLIGSTKHLILDDSDNWRTLDSFTEGDIISSKIVSRKESISNNDWIDFTVDAEHESYILSGLTHHNSGKSVIIASLIKFYNENVEGKILLICPTTSLVEQLYSDIADYYPDWDIKQDITRIYSGMERENKKIILSTWQSLYDKPQSYFEDIEVVMGDECHLYSAKEVSKLFDKCIYARYRHGFTGTLSGEKIHQLQLEGIFGKARQITTTSDLISKSQLSDFKINALVLSYSAASRKTAKEFSYEEEVKFLISNDKRNRFIAKLAASTKGNTLVLFSRVETHGELIYNLIQKYTDRPVYFIYGGTDVDIREDVRIKINSINDGIIVASSQIFSTGINIPSLQNIIFTHPSKSKIRVLQSIGRVLRLSTNKVGPAILFDIVDDLKFRNKTNFSMKHFLERAKLYVQENFNYKIVNVELEK